MCLLHKVKKTVLNKIRILSKHISTNRLYESISKISLHEIINSTCCKLNSISITEDIFNSKLNSKLTTFFTYSLCNSTRDKCRVNHIQSSICKSTSCIKKVVTFFLICVSILYSCKYFFCRSMITSFKLFLVVFSKSIPFLYKITVTFIPKLFCKSFYSSFIIKIT